MQQYDQNRDNLHAQQNNILYQLNYINYYINFETQTQDEILKLIDMKKQENGLSGHCFYYSVASQKYKDEWKKETLKNIIYNY